MALANDYPDPLTYARSPITFKLSEILDDEQIKKINYLLGWALLDDATHQGFVVERDSTLMTEQGLSWQVQHWLRSLEAGTIEELAEQILHGIEEGA